MPSQIEQIKIKKEEAIKIELNLKELREELRILLINNALKFGEGVSRQGTIFDWIDDDRLVILDPRGAYLSTMLFYDIIKDYDVGCIGGLTLAADPIISNLVLYSYQQGKPLKGFIVRKEPKQYGLQKNIEGPFEDNKEVIIVDDAMNSGNSVQIAIDAVEQRGCKIKAIISLVNYKNQGYQRLTSKGYDLHYIFDLADLGIVNKEKLTNIYKLKWKFSPINIRPYYGQKSSPYVYEDKIYVGSDQGKLFCLDLNGNLLWQFQTENTLKGVHSLPQVSNGKVIFGSYDGHLYALDKDYGSVIWNVKPANWIASSPFIHDGVIYIGTEWGVGGGSICAFFEENGELLWEFKTKKFVPCSPKLDIKTGTVVCGSNDFNVYALDKNDGVLKWSYKTGGEVKGPPTLDYGRVYATSFDGTLYCLNLADGELIWKRKLGVNLYNCPAIYKDYVIAGSYNKRVFALNKDNGNIGWMYATNGKILSSPTVYDDKVHIGSNDGNIYAIDANNGCLLWQYKTNDCVTSTPAVKEDILLVNSNDSNLYCFNAQNSTNL